MFLLQLIHLFLTIGIHYLEFEKHLLDLQLAKIERISIDNVSYEGQLLDKSHLRSRVDGYAFEVGLKDHVCE